MKTFATLPDGHFAAVICTEVLEHVPELLVAEVTGRVFARARRLVYLSISTRPHGKTLPNGENANCTVRPPDWRMSAISRPADPRRVEASFMGCASSPPVLHQLNAA